MTLKGNEADNIEEDEIQLHWNSWDWQYSNAKQDCPTINFNGNATSYADAGICNNAHSASTPPILSPPLTPVHKIKQGKLRLVSTPEYDVGLSLFYGR